MRTSRVKSIEFVVIVFISISLISERSCFCAIKESKQNNWIIRTALQDHNPLCYYTRSHNLKFTGSELTLGMN